MRSNWTELGQISRDWVSTYEGILLLRRSRSSKSKKYDFESGDPSCTLVARSSEDCNVWLQFLRSAALVPKIRRSNAIRNELSNHVDSINTTPDPLLFQGQESNPDIIPFVDQHEAPHAFGIELTLDCKEPALPNTPANATGRISILLHASSSTATESIGSTESLGQKQFEGETLTSALSDGTQLDLELSSIHKPAGDLSPTIPDTIRTRLSIVCQKRPIFDSPLASSDLRIASFKSVCDNILSKLFNFDRSLVSERVHTLEFMGESKLCFDLPTQYLKLLVQQEYLMLDSLNRVGSSDPLIEGFRRDRLLSMRAVIEQYEGQIRNLADNQGLKFKSSTDRQNPRFDFIPTNLHLNELAVVKSCGRTVTSHFIVTVSVFSPGSQPYRQGGLFRQALAPDSSNSYPPSCLSLALANSSSPLAGAVTLEDSTSAGRVASLLRRGTSTVVRLRSDLGSLAERLTSQHQADLLIERIQQSINAVRNICNDPMLMSLNDFDFSTELEALVQMVNQCGQSGEDSTSSSLLTKIRHQSSKLSASIDLAWTRHAELLWSTLLSNLLTLVVHRGGFSSNASCSSPSATTSSGSGQQSPPPPPPTMLSTNNLAVFCDQFAYRHHASVCQAITSVLSGLCVAVCRWDSLLWQRMIVCGLLVHFEALVTCHGPEQTMMEDWAWAVESIGNLRVVVRPAVTSATLDTTSNSAPSYDFQPEVRLVSLTECELIIPQYAWNRAPTKVRERGRVRLHLHPVMFLVGINEQQLLAERFDKVSVQHSVNNQGLLCLEAYFQRYIKHYGAPDKTMSDQDVSDLLSKMRYSLKPPAKSKPIQLLEWATEVTLAFGGLRFTSCKSAKDRTAMSVTLEQARWLRHTEWLTEKDFVTTLKTLRINGLRLDNVAKNVGARKFAFNRMQLISFPRVYRPPNGTFASGLLT